MKSNDTLTSQIQQHFKSGPKNWDSLVHAHGLGPSIARFITPLIIGIIMTTVCPMDSKSAGANIPARPPPYAFGIVWFSLYILLGISWAMTGLSDNQILGDVVFSTNVVLMALWVIIYSCLGNKKGALYVLLVIVMAGFALFGCTTGVATALIAPYVGWIVFALMLNYTEVNESADHRSLR
jgi:tryptophan-rich sensory protein